MAPNPFEIYTQYPEHKQRGPKRSTPVIDSVVSEQYTTEKLGLAGYDFPLRTIIIVVGIFFALIIGRVFFLQIVQGAHYRNLAEGNRIQTRVVKALRGVMYDRNGQQLVKNIPNFTLVLQARNIPRLKIEERTAYLKTLQTFAGMDDAAFQAAYTRSSTSGQPVALKEHIPYQEALQMIIAAHSKPGLQMETHYSREYVNDESYSHLFGYTGKINEEEYNALHDSGYFLNDELGKTGLEKQYESELRGEDGFEQVEVDYRGREKTVLSKTTPESGYHLYLSIDARLQELLYAKLKESIDTLGVTGGSAVAIDPRNGKVRALVSYPSFSNNAFAKGISSEEYGGLSQDERKPLFHRAIAGEYPAGSTFKPIVAAAGIEEGVITENTTYTSTGGIHVNGYDFLDYRTGGYGTVNVIAALAKSVNTFFYMVGGGDNETNTGLGIERMMSYARKFGLGDRTEIDIPGEGNGFLPSKEWKEEFKNERWYIGDTYHAAIGQGDVLVTPLQIANATAAIANGGTLYEPRLVEKMVDQNGNTVEEVAPVVKTEQVVSPASIDIARRGMREAVLIGGGRSLLTLPITAAGKTGTAQFGNEEKTHAWFTMFAPYENPELVITVMVEAGGVGESVAVPIAREALREYLNPPSESAEETQK